MARSYRRMRRMVCASAPAGLLRFTIERARLVDGVLWIGPVLQLSPLHGDDLSRLSQRSGLSEIPDFYGSHHGAHCADLDSVALLAPRHPLDFHALPGLEPMALQRPELRPVHDVRPARWGGAFSRRQTCLVRGIPLLLSDFAFEFPHRTLERSFIRLAGNSRTDQLDCRLTTWSGVRRLFGLRLVWAGGTGGLAAFAPGADTVLHAMPVVSLTDRAIHCRRAASSAEPLQQWGVRGHALGPIYLDNQLLRSPRSWRQKRGWLAPIRILRSAGGGRYCALCSRTMAGQPALPLRLRCQLSDFHRVGEYSSLHSGWRDLEVTGQPHCRAIAEFAGAFVRGHRWR